MKRTRPVTSVLALACVVGVAACNTSGSNEQQPPALTAPALPARVSASIAMDHAPSGLIVGPDAVYVANHRGGSIQRIDPETNRVTATVLVGGQLVFPVFADSVDPLWACTNVDSVLHQVDVTSGRLTAAVPANCNGGWRSVINGQVWGVSGGEISDLWVIDARSGEVLLTKPLERSVGPPIFAGGRVLIGSGESGITLAFGPGGEPLTGIPVETPWLTEAGGKVYRVPSDGKLAELDPVTLAVVRTYTVPPHEGVDPTLAADDAGHLYYRPDYTHLYRVDIASGVVDMFLELPWAETPTDIAWGFGSLWLTNFNQDTVWRINTTL